ncbi:MAG: hypothetical protein LN411_06390 [Candidatus Thermoplasmatota archaeon]|nr:hypothetical protein [Candidatus Thermoplasmatota archaeon]
MPDQRRSNAKVRSCDISGCEKTAERSVSGKKVEKAGLDLSSDPAKTAHLCRDHYRSFKKKTKKARKAKKAK